MFDDIKGIEVTLKPPKGPSRVVTVPSPEERERIARSLHEKGAEFNGEVLGWQVVYAPAAPSSYTTQNVDPFTGKKGTVGSPQASKVPARCMIGRGNEWVVTATWANADQPPAWHDSQGVLSPATPPSTGLFT